MTAGVGGLVTLAFQLDGAAQAVALALQVAPAVVLLPRAFRVALVAYPDHLLIRNMLPSRHVRRVRRSRLDGVEVGPAPGPEHGTWVYLRLRGGDLIPVDAMWTHASGPAGTQVCESRADRVREWARDRSLEDR